MIDSLLGPSWSLLEKSKWYRQAGLDTKTLKRLVLIECRKNLALLEPLRLDDGQVPQDACPIVSVARYIQFESIELLLAADDKANKALSELSDISLAELGEDSGDCEDESKEKVVSKLSVSDKLLRIYVRMYSAKAFAVIAQEKEGGDWDGAQRIQFRRRLRNIRENLLLIERALAGVVV